MSVIYRVTDLPDPSLIDDRLIVLDTEASGLHVDDGARVSVVALAWTQEGVAYDAVLPFDQGIETWIGPKDLPKPKGKGKNRVLWEQSDLFGFGAAPNLELEDWCELTVWLEQLRIAYHNAKYDQHIMRAGLRGWGYGIDLDRNLAWDSMVVCPVLWPEHGAALKPTLERLYGVQEREAETKVKRWLEKHCPADNPRYDLLPWDLMEPYARGDGNGTLRLVRHQMEAIEEDSVIRRNAKREMELAGVLYRMERAGLGWDDAGAWKAVDIMRQRMHELREQIPFEPTDEAAKRWFFVEKGITPPKRTDKGKVSIDKEVMRSLIKMDAPGAKEFEEFGKMETAVSMWYQGWTEMMGPDGRLRCSFHQTKTPDSMGKERGTVSGRLSVERIQLHAIPHNYQLPDGVPSVRSLITPREGYMLVEMDISQAEMRAAAGLTRCQPLLDGFARGDDAHAITTRTVWGIDENHHEWDFKRGVGKRLNFAMLYVAGVPTIARQIEQFTGTLYPQNQILMWKAEYKRAMPELSQATKRAERQVERLGYVELVNGRIRWFKDYERLSAYKAFNAIVQGGIAEVMKEWMVDVEPIIRENESYMLLQIHDSLVLEVPIEWGMVVAHEVATRGEKLFAKRFDAPFVIDVKEWKK